jgi:WD40 repeat protein
MTSGFPIRQIKEHWSILEEEYIICIDTNHLDNSIAAVTADNCLVIIEADGSVRTRKFLNTINVYALKFSPDGEILALGDKNGSVSFFSNYGEMISDVCIPLPPSGSPHENQKINLGKICSGNLVKKTFTRWVTALSWSHTQPYVLAVSCNRILCIIDKSCSVIKVFDFHTDIINAISWYERSIASVCFGRGYITDIESSSYSKTWDTKSVMLSVDWSPKGRYIACGCHETTVLIWDVEKQSNLHMRGYPGKVTTLDWDRTGRFLATVGDNAVILWDFSGEGPAGKEPIVLDVHTYPVTTISFSPNGSLLVSGAGNSFTVWKTGLFKSFAYAICDASVVVCTWNKKGDMIYTGHESGKIACWSIRS